MSLKLRNIAITNIKTVEDFYFCAKYCMVNEDFEEVAQEDIDKNITDCDAVCYDIGTDDDNFYFWSNANYRGMKECKHYTVKEFKEYVKELEKGEW